MHRHRELCERAVDPLEIAAGLEAHGIADRTAARFRHRDVFSLAEERRPRAAGTEGGGRGPAVRRARPRRATDAAPEPPGAHSSQSCRAPSARSLSPLRRRMDGGARIAIGGRLGAIGVAVALTLCLRARTPARRRGARSPPYACGRSGCWRTRRTEKASSTRSSPGARTAHWPLSAAPLVGLALAVAPAAAGCARLFSISARRRLDGSRGLEEFAHAGDAPAAAGSRRPVRRLPSARSSSWAGLVFPPSGPRPRRRPRRPALPGQAADRPRLTRRQRPRDSPSPAVPRPSPPRSCWPDACPAARSWRVPSRRP